MLFSGHSRLDAANGIETSCCKLEPTLNLSVEPSAARSHDVSMNRPTRLLIVQGSEQILGATATDQLL